MLHLVLYAKRMIELAIWFQFLEAVKQTHAHQSAGDQWSADDQ